MSLHRDEPSQERLYSFANFYFAGIHAGIQTAHTIARMSQKYAMTEGFVNLSAEHIIEAGDLLHRWSRRGGGETIIVKNGGMQGDLTDLLRFLDSEEHPYPYDNFHESYYAAGGALTNVSIVLPEMFWKTADAMRSAGDILYTSESRKHYAFYNTKTKEFSPMSNGQPVICDAYVISRRENMKKAEAEKREPGLFPNEEMLTFTDFDVQLMHRMNKCGLM